MPSADELLAELLESLQAVHSYLCGDLNSERLSAVNERRRQTFAKTLNDLIEKVYVFDPDILSAQKKKKKTSDPTARPLPSDPTARPLPSDPTARPLPSKLAPHVPPPHDGQEDEYTEFTPHDGSIAEAPELYEDMHSDSAKGNQDELYEESEPSVTSGGGGGKGNNSGPNELYEDPVPGGLSSNRSSAQLPNGTQHKETEERLEPPYRENKVKHSASRDSIVSQDVAWEPVYDKSVKPGDKKLKPSDLKNVKCKGVLEKLGGVKGETWQERYCVLSEIYVYFYNNEKSKNFKNRVAVPMYAVALAPEHTNSKKHHFSFKLSCQSTGGKKDYHFRTKTEDDRTKWVDALKEIGSTLQPFSSSTMRADPTQPQIFPKKSPSADNLCEEAEPEEEYQDMIPEEKEAMEEYEEVVPAKAGEEQSEQIQELTESMEEYVDVQPNGAGTAEDYEDPGSKNKSPKPPPTSSRHAHPPLASSRSGGAPPLPDKLQAPTPVPNVTVDTNKIYTQPPEGVQYEKVYVLLWDFVTSEKDEVSLKRGDLVYVQDPKHGMDWWLGELLDPNVAFKVGRRGYFPTSYVAAAFEVVV